MLNKIWMFVVRLFVWSKGAAKPNDAVIYAAGLVPPPAPRSVSDVASTAPIESEVQSRATRRAMASERRKWEKARRKFDKFVEPVGPEPRKLTRSKTTTPTVVVASQTCLCEEEPPIIGPHHTNRNTDVLYEEDEFYGRFCFRDTIIDDLPVYFEYLDRMKRADPQAWGFYKEVGALIVPYVGISDIMCDLADVKDKKGKKQLRPLSPWFLATRPAFGCIAYGTNKEIERLETRKRGDLDTWIPKFVYFQKCTRDRVQPVWERIHGAGDYYLLTVYWDKRHKKRKSGAPQTFPLFISDTGEIRSVKCNMVQLRGKRTTHYGYRKGGLNPVGVISQIPQHRWAIPDELHHWAKTHGTTASNFIADLFQGIAEAIELAVTMVRVSVEDHGRHAYFAIDMQRMPYFFQDRDRVLTASGLTKPIFHSVKAHQDKTGKMVPMHFRGLRDFTWGGRHVRITVPGIDHPHFNEMDVAVHTDLTPRQGMPFEKMGAVFQKMIDGASVEEAWPKVERQDKGGEEARRP